MLRYIQSFEPQNWIEIVRSEVYQHYRTLLDVMM